MAKKKRLEPLSKFHRYVRLSDQETFDAAGGCDVILIHQDDEKAYIEGADGNGVDFEDEIPPEVVANPRTIRLTVNGLIEFYVEHHAKESV